MIAGKLGITLNIHWCEPLTNSTEDLKACERYQQFRVSATICIPRGSTEDMRKKWLEPVSFRLFHTPQTGTVEVSSFPGSVTLFLLRSGSGFPSKGPRPLAQCRFRSVEFCTSTSAAGAASRTVQLQTWARKHSPHPSYYSLLLPLHVLHRLHSTQE
jgi:hypothetical protein